MVTPSQDTVFAILANELRRKTCLALSNADEHVHTLADIAETVDPAVDHDMHSIKIALHHQHLPKLDRAGLIDYDSRSRTIRYRGQPSVEKWAVDAKLLAERDRRSDC